MTSKCKNCGATVYSNYDVPYCQSCTVASIPKGKPKGLCVRCNHASKHIRWNALCGECETEVYTDVYKQERFNKIQKDIVLIKEALLFVINNQHYKRTADHEGQKELLDKLKAKE